MPQHPYTAYTAINWETFIRQLDFFINSGNCCPLYFTLYIPVSAKDALANRVHGCYWSTAEKCLISWKKVLKQVFWVNSPVEKWSCFSDSWTIFYFLICLFLKNYLQYPVTHDRGQVAYKSGRTPTPYSVGGVPDTIFNAHITLMIFEKYDFQNRFKSESWTILGPHIFSSSNFGVYGHQKTQNLTYISISPSVEEWQDYNNYKVLKKINFYKVQYRSPTVTSSI
jgi:hypothetical protein